MESQNLSQITGHRITEIAIKAKVSREYVRLLLNGKRKAKTVKAKSILAAALVYDQKITEGKEGMDKELIIIGEND